MSHGLTVLLLAVAAIVLFLSVVLVIRRPLQRRLFAGTGLEEWRAVARQLPWRDRWSLYVANSLGRPAPPRLGPLAVQRGQAVAAVISRTVERGSRLRKAYLAIGVLGLVSLAVNVVALVAGDRSGHAWISLLSALFITVIGFFYRPLQNGQARLVQRSVRRNQR